MVSVSRGSYATAAATADARNSYYADRFGASAIYDARGGHARLAVTATAFAAAVLANHVRFAVDAADACVYHHHGVGRRVWIWCLADSATAFAAAGSASHVRFAATARLAHTSAAFAAARRARHACRATAADTADARIRYFDHLFGASANDDACDAKVWYYDGRFCTSANYGACDCHVTLIAAAFAAAKFANRPRHANAALAAAANRHHHARLYFFAP